MTGWLDRFRQWSDAKRPLYFDLLRIYLGLALFVKGLQFLYKFKDTWFGIVKSASFGMTITLVGCIVGLATHGGAEGVGRSTTSAVVYSAVLILVLDAFWAVALL